MTDTKSTPEWLHRVKSFKEQDASGLKTTTVRTQAVWGNDMHSPRLPTKSQMSSSEQLWGTSTMDIQGKLKTGFPSIVLYNRLGQLPCWPCIQEPSIIFTLRSTDSRCLLLVDSSSSTVRNFKAIRSSKLLKSLRTCARIFPRQATVYSARRPSQKVIRETKDTGSEIRRSRVLPVCLRQETLTQLEFCDM